MFNVEYRTISSNPARFYATCVAVVGSHKARSVAEASAYVVKKFGRVEVVSVQYVGAL